MPLLDLTYPEGALTAPARAELIDTLTAAVLRSEGLPDVPTTRAAAWAFVHERPHWAVNRGGAPVDEAVFLLRATVPTGALGPARKATLVDEATTAILAAAGGTPDPLRVWVLITEMPDGTWGAGGAPVDFAALRSSPRPPRPATTG